MIFLLDRIEKCSIILLTLIMVFLVSLQVLNRFILHLAMPWTEETARYVFIWLVFLSASYATHKKAHIGVEIVVNKLSNKWKKTFLFMMHIACLAFSLMLVLGGIRIVWMQNEMSQLSPAMGIPMYLPYLALPIGGVFMFVRFLYQINEQVFHIGG